MFTNTFEFQRFYWTVALLIAIPFLTVLFLEVELLLKRRNSTFKSVFHPFHWTLQQKCKRWCEQRPQHDQGTVVIAPEQKGKDKRTAKGGD